MKAFIKEWWIIVPLLGILAMMLCAILSAFSIDCGALGPIALLMSVTVFFGFLEEPAIDRS